MTQRLTSPGGVSSTRRIDELVAMLSEECGEVVQVIGKIQRHGFQSFNPFEAIRMTNVDLLRKECLDILAVMTMMESEGVLLPVSRKEIDEIILRKKKWMHT